MDLQNPGMQRSSTHRCGISAKSHEENVRAAKLTQLLRGQQGLVSPFKAEPTLRKCEVLDRVV